MASRVYGSIIGLRPEFEARYRVLHRHVFPGVLDRIARSNIRNYSIDLHEGILFGHFEHVGDDDEADMAAMAADDTTREWWQLTDPMQVPLDGRGQESGGRLESVYAFDCRQARPRPATARSSRVGGAVRRRAACGLRSWLGAIARRRGPSHLPIA